MNLQLSELINCDNIDKIQIRGIDGMLYQAIAFLRHDDTVEQKLIYQGDKPYLSRSLLAVKDDFEWVNAAQYVLVTDTAYDEMIGLGTEKPLSTLEQPLHWK